MDGRVAGDLALRQGARRENILYGSLSDEQRRRSAKDRGTLRAEFWRAPGGVALQSLNPAAMLLRRALPAARQNSARPVPFLRWVLGEKNQHQEYSKEQQVNAALQHVGLAAGKGNHAYSEC